MADTRVVVRGTDPIRILSDRRNAAWVASLPSPISCDAGFRAMTNPVDLRLFTHTRDEVHIARSAVIQAIPIHDSSVLPSTAALRSRG